MIISYNVQAYEMRTLSEVVTLEIDRFVCIKITIPGMIGLPYNYPVLYVPPYVELLGSRDPQF